MYVPGVPLWDKNWNILIEVNNRSISLIFHIIKVWKDGEDNWLAES